MPALPIVTRAEPAWRHDYSMTAPLDIVRDAVAYQSIRALDLLREYPGLGVPVARLNTPQTETHHDLR